MSAERSPHPHRPLPTERRRASPAAGPSAGWRDCRRRRSGSGAARASVSGGVGLGRRRSSAAGPGRSSPIPPRAVRSRAGGRRGRTSRRRYEIALDAVRTGMRPGTLVIGCCCAHWWPRAQSPLASHHSACAAMLNPSGGSSCRSIPDMSRNPSCFLLLKGQLQGTQQTGQPTRQSTRAFTSGRRMGLQPLLDRRPWSQFVLQRLNGPRRGGNAASGGSTSDRIIRSNRALFGRGFCLI